MSYKPAYDFEGRGVYTILIKVDASAFIEVGKLGRIKFSGLYSYTGSALGKGSSSLNGRVLRHLGLRSRKRLRWHIDYLLEHPLVRVEGVITSTAEAKSKECQISKNISNLAGLPPPVRKFGATDCSCESHLAELKGNPDRVISTIVEAHMRAGLKPKTVLNPGFERVLSVCER
jgi:Uri superfamily endonuclease